MRAGPSAGLLMSIETAGPSTAVDLPAIISRYAERFHELGGNQHHVASPLSAWMLLALCAPAAAGRLRDELSEILGLDAVTAGVLVARLLDKRPDSVATAAAIWIREGLASARIAAFLATLHPSVERGERIPTQQELDDWARRKTFDLIETFPIRPADAMPLLLAGALVTKVKWLKPFELYPSADLGPQSSWQGGVKCVLHAEGNDDHLVFIASSDRAGDVAVHAAWASDGLLVASVIAEPHVPSTAVLATAHEIATRIVRSEPLSKRPLRDLPLETAIWTIEERLLIPRSTEHPAEAYSADLPAWEASNKYDLDGRNLGFAAAVESLADATGLPLMDAQARQSVVARYTRLGFEAAAVTAIGFTTAGWLPPPVPGLLARLRFSHPYAVVAVTHQSPSERESNAIVAGPWHGVPVFSAWVTEVKEAGASPTGSREMQDAEYEKFKWWLERRAKR